MAAAAQDSSWIMGGDTRNDYTSAFDILDTVLHKLAQLQKSGRFPNLARVTMAGFSAGAQLLNRWSFFAPKHFSGLPPPA